MRIRRAINEQLARNKSFVVRSVVSLAAILMMLLASESSSTPLHGLSAVFQAQTPTAYRTRLKGVADEMRKVEIRGGTIEDLKRLTESKRNAERTEVTDPKGPKTPDAKPAKLKTTTKETAPFVVQRDLATKQAKSLIDVKRRNAVVMNRGHMQALELTEVLAFFNAENVNWDGHMGPKCDYPGFRQAALDGLRAFGSVGAEAVVQAAGQELTAVTIPREVTRNPVGYANTFNSVYRGRQNDPLTRDRKTIPNPKNMTPEQLVQKTLLMNPTYHQDLLDLLVSFKEKGLITTKMEKHLEVCAAGQKDKEVKPLAEAVAAIFNAYTPERLRTSSVIDLLVMFAKSEGAANVRVGDELSSRSPRYSEVKEDIQRIWQFTKSDTRKIAAAANSQMENAFQRAPISHCLYWIGQGDDKLSDLIWAQLDVRIKRAASDRKAAYHESALLVLAHKEANNETRRASLQLIQKVGQKDTVKRIVQMLPTLPRNIWPACGSTLKKLTGEDFGPREGDGLAEVVTITRKWRNWIESNK